MTTRIALVGGRRLQREALEHVLNTSGHVAVSWSASSLRESRALLLDQPPDVLVVTADAREDYAELTLLRNVSDAVRVVVVGAGHCPASVALCASNGVLGYLAPDASTRELMDAIETVARGELWCPPEVVSILFRYMNERAPAVSRLPASADPVDELTRREQDVVQLIAQGLTNKQIAHHLSIEVATVKSHVHRILAKLGLERRAQVVALLTGEMPRAS
jgi:two-component system nitrate/nitrite response regulator NarL